jgi:hypothetical protein
MSVFIPSAGGGASDYLEYGWVCAPNAGGQSISANTITALTIDTEIQDAGGHGSISANQITLAAGTYYFEARTQFGSDATQWGGIFSLYNITDSAYVSRNFAPSSSGQMTQQQINGQFTITSTKTFELRIAIEGAATIKSGNYNTAFTLATAGADQRTTIKLWKLA